MSYSKLNSESKDLGSSAPTGQPVADTLIVGNGRLATQLQHYFKKTDHPFSTWNRILSPEELYKKAVSAKRILLAISDKAISSFIDGNEELFREKFLVHFSATTTDDRALGFHPLGSFTLTSEVDFSRIYFQGIHPESTFHEALPMFHNNHYTKLDEEQMNRYHALCVLGGNYTALLWKNFFDEMQKLGIPTVALNSYVQMITDNVIANPSKAVTGPLVRGDQATIEKNLAALANDPQLYAIYESFVRIFKPVAGENKNAPSTVTTRGADL